MSDDIVERLSAQIESHENWEKIGGTGWETAHADLRDARDEIEALYQALAKLPAIQSWTGEIVHGTGTYEYIWQCPVCDSAFSGDDETCIEHHDDCAWQRACRITGEDT